VIEVNPRLTTSYVGLRAAAKTNLAVAMIRVAEGDVSPVDFLTRSLEFDAFGNVSFPT
jgi:tyramine---L-glutamate ligase